MNIEMVIVALRNLTQEELDEVHAVVHGEQDRRNNIESFDDILARSEKLSDACYEYDNQYPEGRLIDSNITFNGQCLDTLIADELIDMDENHQYWDLNDLQSWFKGGAEIVIIEQKFEQMTHTRLSNKERWGQAMRSGRGKQLKKFRTVTRHKQIECW